MQALDHGGDGSYHRGGRLLCCFAWPRLNLFTSDIKRRPELYRDEIHAMIRDILTHLEPWGIKPMAIAGLLVAIVAAVVSGASAVIAWFGTHPRPELAGKITLAIHMGTDGAVRGTAVLIHCIITNEVTSPVYAISYVLEVKRNDEWLRLHRAYDASMPVLYVGEGTLEVTMTPSCFIDREPQKVDFGSPLMGFLLYYYDERLDEEDIQLYRLTVGDVFGREHRFVLTSEASRKFMSTRVRDQFGLSSVDIFRLAGAEIREAGRRGGRPTEPAS
jgi:hypothetical protein